MPSILECNRIVGSVYPYSLNFAILFTSHLSSILALFFSKSLVKLLLHDGRSSILTQVLLFHQLFHCHKCSYGQAIQNPTHLVLECSEYRADRVEAFEGFDNNQKSMEYLFNTKIDREKLFKFLEKTKIASKK